MNDQFEVQEEYEFYLSAIEMAKFYFGEFDDVDAVSVEVLEGVKRRNYAVIKNDRVQATFSIYHYNDGRMPEIEFSE